MRVIGLMVGPFEVFLGSCQWWRVVGILYCVIDTPTVSVIAAPTQASRRSKQGWAGLGRVWVVTRCTLVLVREARANPERAVRPRPSRNDEC